MPKKETPPISDYNIVKLMLASYGAKQYLAHLNRKLSQAVAQMENCIDTQNPLGAAKSVSQIREIVRTLDIILADKDATPQIDKLSTR